MKHFSDDGCTYTNNNTGYDSPPIGGFSMDNIWENEVSKLTTSQLEEMENEEDFDYSDVFDDGDIDDYLDDDDAIFYDDETDTYWIERF